MDMIFYWGAALLLVFVVGKKIIKALMRAHDERLARNLCAPVVKQALLEERLKSIFTKYEKQVARGDTVEQDLVNRSLSFVLLVIGQAIKESNRNAKDLTEDELFIAMLIVVVASDYISQIMQSTYEFLNEDGDFMNFERFSIACCSCLLGQVNKSKEEAFNLFSEVLGEYNRMTCFPSEHAIIRGIAKEIDAFLYTGKREHLEKLSLFYQGLVSSMVSNDAKQQQEV